ncbi:unnamed protein product [Protopolystoma xenopodis]|uniref:Uncharacterized protein n=1 Tax=Protopolystoma xenopodis TaxID=117903 RepID=A0A3S5AA86_9PLAT|nr:unnamed protein product [Protopolystoma xenopodis]
MIEKTNEKRVNQFYLIVCSAGRRLSARESRRGGGWWKGRRRDVHKQERERERERERESESIKMEALAIEPVSVSQKWCSADMLVVEETGEWAV